MANQDGDGAEKEVSESMQAQVQVSQDPGVSDAAIAVKSATPRSGVVSRLLAQFSRMNDEYVDYQMEAGVWRKLAL